MRNTHTQGNWYVTGWQNLSVKVLQDDGEDYTVCLMVAGGDPKTGQLEEWQANARLIAAAPELLETLEDVFAALGDGSYNEGHVSQITRVLEKARGE
jgi:hypothetical protein